MKATKARKGAARTAEPRSAVDPFPPRLEGSRGAARSSGRRPARKAASTTAGSAERTNRARPGLWPGVTAGAEIPTEVPRIDDVLRAPLRTPAGSPQPHSHARTGRTGGADRDSGATPRGAGARRKGSAGASGEGRSTRRTPGARTAGARAEGAARVAAVRRRAERQLGRARAVSGVWARTPMLAATAAVALLAGVATGLGYDVISGLGADDEVAPPPTPQACAVTQEAWARSANAQVGMSAEEPASLVKGFAGAREALLGVQPPAQIADDWNLVVGYVDEVAKAVDEVEDESEIEGAVVGALGRLDTPGMTEAAQRITTYLKAGCEL